MGLVLSFLYLLTTYLTPGVLFGPLAAYRIELILAAVLLLVSIPRLQGSFLFKTPQSLALIGLTIAAFLSVLLGERWVGGAVSAFLELTAAIFAYFLVCLHFNTRKRLKVLVLLLIFACLFVIVRGAPVILFQAPKYGPILASTGLIDQVQWNSEHAYVIAVSNDTGEWIYRLRGLGTINDPNDLGQLIVCVIPLVFFFWRPKKMLTNIPFVIFPVCVLLMGVFFTHSRSALLALIAIALVASRRRIGTVPATVLAGGLFVAAMALQFTGGRQISAESGADRTGLWGESIQLLKTHPIFGVGAGRLGDYLGLTAHNTILVCAAELGLFGLFFWTLFLFPTVRDCLVIASGEKVGEGNPLETEEGLYPQAESTVESIDNTEINRMGSLMVLSLTGFLVTGMFLSRAFTITWFLLGGMIESVYQMALERGMVAPRMRMSRVLGSSGGLAIALLVMMYCVVRVLNLFH